MCRMYAQARPPPSDRFALTGFSGMSAPITDEFDGFAVLEEAAVTLLGHPNERELIESFRTNLEQFLAARTGDAALAADLANRFIEIIKLRRSEIKLASGSNPSGAVQ